MAKQGEESPATLLALLFETAKVKSTLTITGCDYWYNAGEVYTGNPYCELVTPIVGIGDYEIIGSPTIGVDSPDLETLA